MKAITNKKARIVDQAPYDNKFYEKGTELELVGDVLDDGSIAVRFAGYTHIVKSDDLDVLEEQQ